MSTPRSAARAIPVSPTVDPVRPAFVAQAVLVGVAIVIYARVLRLRSRDT